MKTKAPILLIGISCMLMISLESYAQFSAGVKAGLNLSTLSVDEKNTSYGYLPGYQAGGFAGYRIDKFSFELDVLYSTQGASIKLDGKKMTTTSRYVNLPLSVKYHISSFNIHIGPQLGFLTCLHSDYHPITHEPFEEQDYTKAYKKSDYGLNIGGGWSSENGIVVDLRYYIGLADISNYNGIGSTKNRVLQLSIGYKIYKQ